MTIRFEETDAFQKEFKKLKKRYRTLPKDFEHLRLALHVFAIPTDKHTAVIASNGQCQIIKIRMTCKILRKRSLRVVYAYFDQEHRIEFIEVYFKGDKENEDRERIKRYLNTHDI